MAVKNIDNKLLPIAKRYSDALIEVARNKNELDTVYSDLQAVSEALNSVDELKKFLAHPVIPHADKKEVLKKYVENFAIFSYFPPFSSITIIFFKLMAFFSPLPLG